MSYSIKTYSKQEPDLPVTIHRIEVQKKNEEPPVKTVAKAVAVSISADAKMEILKDTLK